MNGLSVFVRAFLRRDRWLVLWFALGTTLLYWSQAVSVDGLYTTRQAFEEAAALMGSNPAFVAMAGPARALDTTGGQVAWQATAFGAVVVGLMSMFLVGRHTRAEEESGRDELLRAGAVSRRTPMTAAVVVVVAANVVVGACVTASLVAYGLATPGALVLGVGLAGCGLTFGAVALLAAQLTSSNRTAYGITGAVIGAAYGLRAVGDVAGGGLSWLSPIGWYQAMRAYSGERWSPLVLLLVLGLLVTFAAYAAFDRRDYADGLWVARPGRQRATSLLSSPLGLWWRLQRGTLAGWTAGMLLAGLAYGSIGDQVDSLMGDSGLSAELFTGGAGGDLVDGFYATSAAMLALITSGFAVSSTLRVRTEEDEGRLEALAATPLSRSRWWLSQVLFTVVGTLIVLTAAGGGLGLGFALTTGDWRRAGELLGATVVLVPGVLVLSALARVLVGIAPRWASLSWLGTTFCAVVLLFASAFRFPDWVVDLSPFTRLGRYPAQAVPWSGVALVLAVAFLLSAVGWAAFRRRDLVTR